MFGAGDVVGSARPTCLDPDSAEGEERLGKLVACALPLGHGQALAEQAAGLADPATHGQEQGMLAQGVRQVVLEAAGQINRTTGHLAGAAD